jgi:hypothetical protein
VIGGGHDQRALGQIVALQRFEDSTELFVGDSSHVREPIRTRHASKPGTILFAQHVRHLSMPPDVSRRVDHASLFMTSSAASAVQTSPPVEVEARIPACGFLFSVLEGKIQPFQWIPLPGQPRTS